MGSLVCNPLRKQPFQLSLLYAFTNLPSLDISLSAEDLYIVCDGLGDLRQLTTLALRVFSPADTDTRFFSLEDNLSFLQGLQEHTIAADCSQLEPHITAFIAAPAL